MISLDILRPSCTIVLGVFLSGLLLTTTMHAQERGPSVSVKIIHVGTVQGDAVVIPPQQKTGQQAITYPRDAAAEGTGGTVILKVLVASDGTIRESQVVEEGSDSRLLRAAVEGLRRAGLTPGTLDSVPKEMQVRVEITFDPGNKEKKEIFSLSPENKEKKTSADADQVDTPGGEGEVHFGSVGDTTAIEEPQESSESEPEYGIDSYVPDATPPSYDQQELAKAVVYPEVAKKNGIQGHVAIAVQIDKDGTPLQTVVRQSSDEIFEENAVRAAKSITYTPAVQYGKPIKMWLTYIIRFELR